MSLVRIGWRAIQIACVLALMAIPARAQQGQDAVIVGAIRDASRAVIAGATVTVGSNSLIGGARSVPTAHDGVYRLPALPAGEYELTVTAPGFRQWKQASIVLRPGGTVIIDATLALEGVAEVVNVSAMPASGLDGHTSAASTIIPRGVLDNLTLIRHASGLVQLV